MGPQRRPQRRLGRRLEEVAKAVGGGYCRYKRHGGWHLASGGRWLGIGQVAQCGLNRAVFNIGGGGGGGAGVNTRRCLSGINTKAGGGGVWVGPTKGPLIQI